MNRKGKKLRLTVKADGTYLDIYETADKGIASNVALDDQTVLEMQRKLKDAGCPVTTMVTYSNMENYEVLTVF